MIVEEVDQIDHQIIKLLHGDASLPMSVVAGYIGLHPSTVSYRVRKLVKLGVIKKFTVSVDWRRMGKSVEAALLISCSPKNVTKIAKTLQSLEEVIELHTLTGFSDILAMVTLRDMNEYKEFVEKRIGGIPEIESFRVGIVLDDLKEE